MTPPVSIAIPPSSAAGESVTLAGADVQIHGTDPASYTGPVSDWQIDHPLVLVVDDDEDTRDLVAAILERDGLSTVTASGGDEALAAAAQQPVSAVILDVLMPGTDGHEVCRLLREGPLAPGVPVIMLTALDSLDSELDSVLNGADAYLTKPIRSTELIARLQDLL